MGNMSYCRFRNTLQDLRDCNENIDDHELSLEEKEARESLIELAQEIVNQCCDEDTNVLEQYKASYKDEIQLKACCNCSKLDDCSTINGDNNCDEWEEDKENEN